MPQVGGTCYSTEADAVQAIASAEIGKVVPAGGVVYVVDASASSASVTYTLSPVDGGAPVVYAQTLSPPPCTLLDWPDALQLGWGIGGVWIIVAVILSMRKAAETA